VQKKSGFVLAALALFAFALVSSPAAPPLGATLQPAQEIQAAPAPVASPVLSPVPSPLEPAAVSPVNGTAQPVWLSDGTDTKPGVGRPICRCSKNSQCGTGACCWWPNQRCGICC
jgi:hypothetical protein